MRRLRRAQPLLAHRTATAFIVANASNYSHGNLLQDIALQDFYSNAAPFIPVVLVTS
ncbi:hypothetical protein M378DRAFT_163360 [Amanita muscaria Koide BX008]|uniref:Uncharacterized protein n=1 Tax=Amanita muscaria (strain Koide BX008) TaxID=946122 RepID=A0A0C2X6G7_AMAMK|nr:hypothetical protein M378DRAFT_163360 [Amanita muscaria Koide BX008]